MKKIRATIFKGIKLYPSIKLFSENRSRSRILFCGSRFGVCAQLTSKLCLFFSILFSIFSCHMFQLCDMWSMGVTLYSLVTGRVPWDGAGSIIGVQAAVRTEPLKFPQKPALSYDLIELITKMLFKNPDERITLAEIKEHSWLTNHGTEPLPSEVDNCRLPVTVTDEEVERVVTRIPKLDTLILIKTMLKQHSFQVRHSSHQLNIQRHIWATILTIFIITRIPFCQRRVEEQHAWTR